MMNFTHTFTRFTLRGAAVASLIALAVPAAAQSYGSYSFPVMTFPKDQAFAAHTNRSCKALACDKQDTVDQTDRGIAFVAEPTQRKNRKD